MTRPPPQAPRTSPAELLGPLKLTKLVSRGLSAQKLTFWTLFCRMSKEKTSKIQPCSDIVLARFQRKPKARTRDKMLQFHWYLRVVNDPCHFANFANDVNQNVPRTTKTELDAGFHSTRSRERKRALTSTQNAPQIVPESSEIHPQSTQSHWVLGGSS